MTRYAGGDDRAFAEIYNNAARLILSFFWRACGDRALAEDLTHETLMRLLAHRASYRPGAAVIPWVLTIAKRLYIDHLRSRKQEQGSGTLEPRHEPLDPRPLADQLLERKSLARALEAAISRLPTNQAQLCRLVRDDDLTPGETASLLGIGPNAARVRAHRAYRALRYFIGDADATSFGGACTSFGRA